MYYPSKEKIENIIKDALDKLIVNDAILFEVDINERSITHMLALYLHEYFVGWNVDCEYNRDNHEAKWLILPKDRYHPDLTDISAKTVYPDIIVHHRGTDENLLVIEAKKENGMNLANYDIAKLKGFKKELSYQHAVLIKFFDGSCPRYEICFINNNA